MPGDMTTDIGARIDALIADATTLARAGAAQRALSVASDAYEAKRAGRNCVR
jgi:hypothetical protein